jgi:hypothetical protein
MAGDIKIFEQLKIDSHLQDIIQQLPLYAGMFDPHLYIEWELKVDAEFDKYDLSEHQMIFVASSALTNYALTTWKHMFLNIMLIGCLQN